MSSEQHEHVSRMFLEARGLEAAERVAFLGGLEPELRSEVESLLEHDTGDVADAGTPGVFEGDPVPDSPDGGGGSFEAEVARLLDAAQELVPFSAEADGEDAATGAATIGDFRILRKLGAGGMAVVYEAEQVSLRRKVALKILPSHLRFSSDAIRKFHREAEAGGRQSHAGIAAIYALGEHAGVHYIAQELVPGGRTLSHELKRLREADELPSDHFRRSADLVAEVADALGHAHASGVIHRDVKPSNILLTADSRPKVADFGLAKVEDALTLSRTGDLVGTPFYMSPEQTTTRGEGLDHRTDVYSLGVTLYELLTLQRPFDGDSSQDVLEKIIAEEARDPRQVGPQVPRDLATICLKAMEKEPARRYQTMAELGSDLRRFLADRPIRARPSGPLRRSLKWIRRNRLRSVAAASLIVAVAATAVLTFVLMEEKSADAPAAPPRYASLPEALDIRDWRDLGSHRSHQQSPLHTIDPGDPNHFLLHALLLFGPPTEEAALEDLGRCLDACERRGEPELARDAHYLRGVIGTRLASAPGCSPERSRELLRNAESDFASAAEGHSDPAASLFPRPDDPTARLDALELSLDHPFVPLCRASVLFCELYKGGLRLDYERAIQDLRTYLQHRPDHLIARTLLGRTLFFHARTNNLLHLLDDAERCLRESLDRAEEAGSHLALTTLGQVLLLRGDHAGARQVLERAVELSRLGELHSQNTHAGLATVALREGKLAEAERHFERAREIQRADTYIRVALAELHLRAGDTGEALRWAELALQERHPLEGKAPTDIGAAYLVFARARLALGDPEEARRALASLKAEAVESPRDRSLAAILAANQPSHYSITAAAISVNPGDLAVPGSPICMSALGTLHLSSGEHRSAIASFDQAIRTRSAWPDDVREYHWADTARDRYLLAVAQYELDRIEDAGRADAWREIYRMAEDEVLRRGLPFDYPDILEAVRARAKRDLPLRAEGTD